MRLDSVQGLVDVLGLETLNATEALTFPMLLEKLYETRFCGSVILHFAGGRPLAVVMQQETRIVLDTGK